MKEYSEEEILLSYKGRCISDREHGQGYCGSCSIEIHRRQLKDPKAWIHHFVPDWIKNQKPKPTTADLQAANTLLREALELYKKLEENSWDLRCVDVSTGGDDYDILWVVIEHYQSKPHDRDIGSGKTPLEAIKEALKPKPTKAS